MGNLVVADEEYRTQKKNIVSFGTKFEARLQSLNVQLDLIRTNALKDGALQQNVELFTTHVKLMSAKTAEATAKIANELDVFIEDIDAADKYLYD